MLAVITDRNMLPKVKHRWLRNIYKIPLFAVIAMCLPFHALMAQQVNDIRVGKQQDATRFVIELDKEVPFHIFTLNTPERLVIDIPNATLQLRSAPVLAGTVIDRYRTGLYKEGIVRIVLDLNAAVQLVRSDSLPEKNRFRIVIDMAPIASEQSPAFSFASSGWKAYADNIASNKDAKQSAKKDKKRVIVIDPGHGGADPGGVVDHIREKHIVLSFSKLLQKRLNAQGKYRAVLTRNKDTYIPLRDRFKVADSEKADLFISIHADKIHVKTIRGFTVYTLSEKASDEESAALAHQENRSDILLGSDLNQYDEVVSDILIDRAQEWAADQSWRVSKKLVSHLRTRIPLSRKAQRFANFAVLKSPNVPSILIELGYLTNESDLKNLQSRNFKDKVVDGMVEGLNAYFEELDAGA
ncbi:MAG: N-acetylmuramoyl-L-alanine amidase [Alphaproteobacteria bacterium]|nr:N-acetylmuramoyl-L-alanine amidase [Alphaproteobacteria bacterium]